MEEVITVLCNPCALCNKSASITVPKKAYDKWIAGAFIQDAWPNSTADDRELLITGTHPDCWEELTKDFD